MGSEDKIWVPCDLCGSEDHILLFSKEGFDHVRCRGCGMVFVNPRLADHLEIQKRSGTGSMGENRLTASQRRRLRKEVYSLEPFRRINRVVEVGAGKGWFLAEAKQAGWETWAVEINADALESLAGKEMDRIITEPAESFDAPPGCADVVRIWDVVEHLQSPGRALDNIHRTLRPGGLLRLSTTNFASLSRWINGPEWVYLNGADHVFLFEPSTITRLLEDTGFSKIRVRTRSFNMRRKQYHPEKDLPPRLSFLSPMRKVIDELIRFTRYGHQMIVTAVKTDTTPHRRGPWFGSLS